MSLDDYLDKMGWRLRSGWSDHQLAEGNNPHSCVVRRQNNLDYWNFNDNFGAGYLIYYDIRVRDAYRRAGRPYPWAHSIG